MNWINSIVRPKIRSILRKKDLPDNLWVKCPETGQMIYYKDLEANQFVVPGSNYHMRMSAGARSAEASCCTRASALGPVSGVALPWASRL